MLNDPLTVLAWLTSLIQHLKASQKRACVVLAGEADWQTTLLEQWLEHFPIESGIWVGRASPYTQLKSVLPQDAQHFLGQETQSVVFSSDEGIDPNSLGIFSGMIQAGGVAIILLKTPWQAWQNPAVKKYLNSPYDLADVHQGFNQFLQTQLQNNAFWIEPTKPLPSLPNAQIQPPYPPSNLPTQDQLNAIQAIERVAFGHRHRPLILTAERGRGKSTVLGLAALALIEQGKQQIILTASRPHQIQTAIQVIEQAEQGDKVGFIPPDQLISTPPQADILMVDEAAHLPLPMLEKLVSNFPRVILATTTQGYEGSGNGFVIQLAQSLNQLTPGWKQQTLHQPIRWQAGDYLEHTLNQIMLMNTSFKPLSLPMSQIKIKRMMGAELLSQPDLLADLFQLMSLAHYQTTPNDLMQWLEVPNIVFWLAQSITSQSVQLVGAVIAIEEGGIAQITDATPFPTQGLKGHLVPRWLYQYYDDIRWLQIKSLRIMRIAVHTDIQQQGIGTQLIQAVLQTASEFDFISASFGSRETLNQFWQKQGFKWVGMGIKKDKASGRHSAFMLKALSKPANALTATAQAAFKIQFAHQLLNDFQALEAPLVMDILAQLQYPQTTFPQSYLTHQPYAAISAKLRQWLLANPKILSQLPPKEAKLVISKVLQNQPGLGKFAEKQLKIICTTLQPNI